MSIWSSRPAIRSNAVPAHPVYDALIRPVLGEPPEWLRPDRVRSRVGLHHGRLNPERLPFGGCTHADTETSSDLTPRSSLTENDDRSGGEHLGPSASPATDLVNHALEMLEIAHAHPDERVGVPGERERLDDLREVDGSRIDVGNLRARRKAQLDERLDVLRQQPVVEHCGIAADETGSLEPDNAPLCRWRRQANQPTNLARRATGVLDQSIEDVPVGLIQGWSHGFQIVTQILFSPSTLNDDEATWPFYLIPPTKRSHNQRLWR